MPSQPDIYSDLPEGLRGYFESRPSPSSDVQVSPPTSPSDTWTPAKRIVDGEIRNSRYSQDIENSLPKDFRLSGTFDVIAPEGRQDLFEPHEISDLDIGEVKEMLSQFQYIDREKLNKREAHRRKRKVLESLDKPNKIRYYRRTGSSYLALDNALWSAEAVLRFLGGAKGGLHDEHVVPVAVQIAEIEFRIKHDPSNSPEKIAHLIASFPRTVLTAKQAKSVDQLGRRQSMPQRDWGLDSLSLWSRYDDEDGGGNYNARYFKEDPSSTHKSLSPVRLNFGGENWWKVPEYELVHFRDLGGIYRRVEVPRPGRFWPNEIGDVRDGEEDTPVFRHADGTISGYMKLSVNRCELLGSGKNLGKICLKVKDHSGMHKWK